MSPGNSETDFGDVGGVESFLGFSLNKSGLSFWG